MSERYYRPYPDGSLRCRPGGATNPAECGFHPEHHFCETCKGYYGVPHDGIHEGLNAHPRLGSWLSGPGGCVCRPCQDSRAPKERTTVVDDAEVADVYARALADAYANATGFNGSTVDSARVGTSMHLWLLRHGFRVVHI